jgi:hypothetical protein
MKIDTPEPLLNARFRIEIDGLRTATAIEVIFPDARIVGDGETPRAVQYGTLTLRRGMTASGDWYRWWDSARGPRTDAARRVVIVLMDPTNADVNRWTYTGAVPAAYHVSPLNALRSELVVETLELSVNGFSLAFGSDELS